MLGDSSVESGPLVSVIIPTFNAAETIERALTSVALQSYRPIEIVVADDASTDATRQLVKAWKHGEVRLVELPHNQGPGAARNAALAAARGKYVALLDSDDEWLPAKIAKQVAVLERDPAAAMVISDGIWIPRHGSGLVRVFADDTPPVAGPDAWKTLLAYSFVATSTVMARRETVMAIGCFNPKLLIAQDQDLFIRLAMAGSVAVVDEVLVLAHVRPNSHIRRNATRELDFLLPMIKGHVESGRGRLTDEETRRILGQRFTNIGRNIYLRGGDLAGLRLLVRAIALGSEPLANLAFLFLASRPVRFLKGLARRAVQAGAR